MLVPIIIEALAPTEMFNKIFEILKSITFWISSQPNRYRMRGARIEVICFILTRSPNPSILLGQSPYYEMWMPPQEGVYLKESFVSALRRCLIHECNLKVPEESETIGPSFHFRSIRFVGLLPLPDERKGERPVADDIAGTPLEKVLLKSKAYWLATILVKDRDSISPTADGRELIDIKWFTLEEAERIINETNHPKKAALLVKCLKDSRRDLFGAKTVSQDQSGEGRS